MIDITIPFEFTPRQYQLPLLRFFDKPNVVDVSGGVLGKRAVIVWHRRAGKDKTVINILVKEAVKRRGTYFYFFPELKQGRKIVWDGMDRDGFKFLDHIPKEIIFKKNETEMKIELTNGSIIQIVGSDNIDSIVGTNPVGCVFSEYSVQDPKGWEFTRPILAENGGWAIFVYTPRGMNHGWDILQTAKTECELGKENWFYQILTVDDTKAVSKDSLEQEKRQMPQALYEQEFYCFFKEGASQFFKNIDANLWDGALEPKEGKIYTTGVDLAKHNDFTVLTPFEHNTFRIGRQERFNQVDYVLQEAKIESYYHKFNHGTIRIDSTGLGEPVFDHLVARGIGIEPFKFTAESRTRLLNNLRILIEENKLTLPNDERLLDELRSFQYQLNESGRVVITVPENKHDDMVMSLALAVWDAREQINEEVSTDYREVPSFYAGMRFD